MRKKYFLVFFVFIFTFVLNGYCQDVPKGAYHVKGPIPKNNTPNTDRTLSATNVLLDYIQADSVYFPHSYWMSYMFPMNSRYVLSDTGSPLSNEFLLQSFGVMFDTVINTNHKDTGYASDIVVDIAIDSLKIILGQCNNSGLQDTIIVQIDSVANNGYPTSKVYHADTVIVHGTPGLSPSNEFLNPFTLTLKANYPVQFATNKFAVNVFYYGSTFDTMGFLPGFGDTTCHFGGSGIIPRITHIGNIFNGLRANSYSSGYKYFFNDTTRTLPDSNGNIFGVYIPCGDPYEHNWYLQDNPISAYITFNDVTSVNELNSPYNFSVAQNQPNPFNKNTLITYNLQSASNVVFEVYDLAGRQIISTNYGEMAPGRHSINLNASQFGTGVYLYTFTVNGSAITCKMVITQ